VISKINGHLCILFDQEHGQSFFAQPAERALRAVAVGRKNYLFLGSDAGGERAATMYSLLGTIKLNGINPETYLRHVLSVIADYPVNRVDELLPWNLNLNNESLLKAA
jgi:transposase